MSDTLDALERQVTHPNAGTGVLIERGRILDLIVKVREGREDAARLDWLDAVNKSANDRNGTGYGWRFDINHNRAALSDHHVPALKVRQAIDEARASSKIEVPPACRQTVDSVADTSLLARAVRNARARSARKGQKHPRWVAVADAFALGSTFSKQLCARFGMDPDEEVSR